jgi:hypothetical protein
MFLFSIWLPVTLFVLMHCKGLLQYAFEGGLRDIYFKGPRLQGYGFWNGLPLPDICAQLTHTATEVWTSNVSQCVALTDRYFTAFSIGTYGVVYILVLYHLLSSVHYMSMLHYQYRLFCEARDQSCTNSNKIKN